MTGNKVVDQIGKMNFEGNIIPNNWYKHIKTTGGKVDAIGILLLAEIVFWYRPVEIKDEATGQVIGYRIKFKADKLQKSYSQLSEQFGFSKGQIRDAVKRLESAGLITVEFRTITLDGGMKLNNVMYLEPVPHTVDRITYQHTYAEISGDPLSKNPDTLPGNFPIGPPKNPDTNTEITTESTTEKKDIGKTIFDFWNSQGVWVHRQITDPIKIAIAKALKSYNEEEIRQAIVTYAEVLKDSRYWWRHKWSLPDFLNRGMTKFCGNPVDIKQNYLGDRNGQREASVMNPAHRPFREDE